MSSIRESFLRQHGLEPDTKYAGRCLRSGAWITATTSKAWHKAVKAPCPKCGIKGWCRGSPGGGMCKLPGS